MKCRVTVNEKLQKELNEKIWLTGLIMTIVGAIGLGLYAILSTFFGDKLIFEMLFWVMVFVFALGVTYLFLVKSANKRALNNNYTDEIELFEEYCVVQTLKNEEVVGTLKVYYKDLIKVKETENYLFLYPNKMVATSIPKSEFSAEDFSKIKLWVHSARANKIDNK